MKKELMKFLKDEEGMGVIEVALIISILIALALVFKKNVKDLLDKIFKSINGNVGDVSKKY